MKYLYQKHLHDFNKFDGIDWGLIQKLDPKMLHETRDYDTFQEFVNAFVHWTFNQRDQQIFSNSIVLKLFMLIQETVRYMFDCQKELKDKIRVLQESRCDSKRQVKTLQKIIDNKETLLKKSYRDYDKCPLCSKKFKNISYLDNHISKYHNEHMDAWRSIRINKPLDSKKEVSKLEMELDTLKNMLHDQTRIFNTKLLEFRKHTDEINKQQMQQIILQQSKRQVKPKVADNPKKENVVLEEQPKQQHKFEPHIYAVEVSSSDGELHDSDFDIKKQTQVISDAAKQERIRFEMGLPSNYITPRQVSTYLDYNDIRYQDMKTRIRKQLFTEFPLRPDGAYNRTMEKVDKKTDYTDKTDPVQNNTNEQEEEPKNVQVPDGIFEVSSSAPAGNPSSVHNQDNSKPNDQLDSSKNNKELTKPKSDEMKGNSEKNNKKSQENSSVSDIFIID